MPRYHFSLGNSFPGPIGFCASVQAASEADAVARVQKIITQAIGEFNEVELHSKGEDYLAVYINADAVTVADIDG